MMRSAAVPTHVGKADVTGKGAPNGKPLQLLARRSFAYMYRRGGNCGVETGQMVIVTVSV